MIDTERLILRAWREGDAIAHNALCSDPRIAATLGPPPTLQQSREVVARQNELLASSGVCFWAVERRETGTFIGWCGVKQGQAPIESDHEIGWSLAADSWGQGLAIEAGRASLTYAWGRLIVPSIVAITTPGNERSRRLMARLGMERDASADFNDPSLELGDPLRAHVLYRIARPASADA